MNLDPINPYWTAIIKKLQLENEELKKKNMELEEEVEGYRESVARSSDRSDSD